jgi:hypothetical protein
VNAPKPKRRYKLASRVTTQTMTPPMMRFNVLKNQERRRRPHPTTTRERDPNSVAKNTVPIRPTTLARARSSLTVVEKTIGRRRILPNLSARTASQSTRKSMPNSTFSKKETKKEKAKWTKAYKNLKSKEADNVTGKESESSDSEADKKATAKTQTRPDNSDADSDSSSDSSSSSDSNSE